MIYQIQQQYLGNNLVLAYYYGKANSGALKPLKGCLVLCSISSSKFCFLFASPPSIALWLLYLTP